MRCLVSILAALLALGCTARAAEVCIAPARIVAQPNDPATPENDKVVVPTANAIKRHLDARELLARAAAAGMASDDPGTPLMFREQIAAAEALNSRHQEAPDDPGAAAVEVAVSRLLLPLDDPQALTLVCWSESRVSCEDFTDCGRTGAILCDWASDAEPDPLPQRGATITRAGCKLVCGPRDEPKIVGVVRDCVGQVR